VRHYVYYRVPEAQLAPALQALRPLHAELRRLGAAVELLRRPDAPQGRVTLMDVYSLDDAAAAAFEARAAAALAPWLDGQRHVEQFEPLD
jgi:transposase